MESNFSWSDIGNVRWGANIPVYVQQMEKLILKPLVWKVCFLSEVETILDIKSGERQYHTKERDYYADDWKLWIGNIKQPSTILLRELIEWKQA